MEKGFRIRVVFVWAGGKRQGFDWGMGPLANEVWIQLRSLAGSAPRPCGYEDLSRILQPQVVGASGAAQQASFRKQQQAGRSSRAVMFVFCFY